MKYESNNQVFSFTSLHHLALCFSSMTLCTVPRGAALLLATALAVTRSGFRKHLSGLETLIHVTPSSEESHETAVKTTTPSHMIGHIRGVFLAR